MRPSETEDGGLATCSFVPSDKTSKNGRYIHILDNNSNIKAAPSILNKSSIRLTQLAGSAHLNLVYRTFLEMLVLLPVHSDELLYKRQLSDSAIVSNLYASVPTLEQARKIMKELSKLNLRGVPGFFTDKNGNWMMTLSSSSYYVPFFNSKNEIVGLQIRLVPASDKLKYIWFSSTDKPNGTAQKMPLGYSKSHLVKHLQELIFTEGALKGQIIAEKLNRPVVVHAGTGISEEKALEIANLLKLEFPELKTITLAPDADYRENEDVKRAFILLKAAFVTVGFQVKHLKWRHKIGKGLDDALNDDLLTRRLRNDKF